MLTSSMAGRTRPEVFGNVVGVQRPVVFSLHDTGGCPSICIWERTFSYPLPYHSLSLAFIPSPSALSLIIGSEDFAVFVLLGSR